MARKSLRGWSSAHGKEAKLILEQAKKEIVRAKSCVDLATASYLVGEAKANAVWNKDKALLKKIEDVSEICTDRLVDRCSAAFSGLGRVKSRKGKSRKSLGMTPQQAKFKRATAECKGKPGYAQCVGRMLRKG